jgi:hypothetical protein
MRCGCGQIRMNPDEQQRMNDRLIELLQLLCWLPQKQQLAMLYGMIGAIAATADDDLWATVIQATSISQTATASPRGGV